MTWVFEPSLRQRQLLDGAQAHAGDNPSRRARQVVDDDAGFDYADWRSLAKLGWLAGASTMLSPDSDLRGTALFDTAVFVEALGQSLQPDAYIEAALAAAVLHEYAESSDHRRVSSSINDGDSLALWCYPTGFWDQAAERADDQVRLVHSGGQLRLYGRARAIANGASADHLVLAVILPSAGWSHLLVPITADGVVVEPLDSMDLTRRCADIRFDGVVIGPDDQLSRRPTDPSDIEREISAATALQCAESMGAAATCFDVTLEYTKQRVVFGRTVASYQAIKHRLSTMYLGLEAGRAITSAAVGAGSSSQEPWISSAAKSYVADVSCSIVEESMQLQGGVAFTWDSDMHLYLRRVRTNRAKFGSPGAHRNHIARMVGVDPVLSSVFGA